MADNGPDYSLPFDENIYSTPIFQDGLVLPPPVQQPTATIQQPDYAALVAGMYQRQLGRDPEPEGLQVHINALLNGIPPDQLEGMIARSPEGIKYDVNSVFKNSLGRDPTEDDWNLYSQALASGTMDEAGLVQSIQNSAEYTKRQEALKAYPEALNYVTSLYKSELGRDPEAGAAEAMAMKYASGELDKAALLNVFRKSQEYGLQAVDKYGTTLKDLFPTEFGREYTEKDLPFLTDYASQLKAGDLTTERLPGALSQTPEGFVYDMFQKYLGRAPAAGDADGWINKLSSGTATKEQVEAGIKRSEEARAYAIAEQNKKNLAATASADAYYKANMDALRAQAAQNAASTGFAPTPAPAGVLPSVFQPMATPTPAPAPAATTPAATAAPAAGGFTGTTPAFGGFFQPTAVPQATAPEPFAATPINVPVFGPAPLPTRGAAPEITGIPEFNPFPEPFQAATPATIYSPTFFTSKK